jgi:hypothetical protein
LQTVGSCKRFPWLKPFNFLSNRSDMSTTQGQTVAATKGRNVVVVGTQWGDRRLLRDLTALEAARAGA